MAVKEFNATVRGRITAIRNIEDGKVEVKMDLIEPAAVKGKVTRVFTTESVETAGAGFSCGVVLSVDDECKHYPTLRITDI